MGDEKSPFSIGRPFHTVFHASLLLLGTVIALNVSLAFLRPLLPWIVGGMTVAFFGWLVVVIVRWRRSRW